MDASFVDRARFKLRPSRARSTPARLEVQGASLRVTEAGSGPLAVVLTPDPPNVLEHHALALDALSASHRAIGIEMPGFGFSTPPPGFGFSIAENAEVMLAALEALDVRRAVLVFPCLAGLVALEMARRDPARIAKVVTVQTPCFTDAIAWSERVDFRGVLKTPIVGQLVTRAMRRPLARAWYGAALPKGASAEPYLGTALDAYARGGDYCLASALQALRRGPADATPVDVPVLSVWGRADRTHRRSDPERLLAHAPRANVVAFDAAGHFPDLEEPERFWSEVLRFVEDVPS